MATTKLNTRDTQGYFDLDASAEPLLTGVNVLKTGQDSLQYLLSGMKWLKSNTFPIIGVNSLSNNYLSRWDDTNGKFINSLIYDDGTNVGIKTSNPIWDFVISKNGASGIEFDIDNGTPGWNGIYSYNRSSVGYTPLRFEASKYNFSSGNVGIGTSSPLYKLQVNGIISSYATSGTNNSRTIMYADDNGAYYTMDGGVTKPIIFKTWTNGTETMRIDTNGNVGIGTNTPTEKLDVDGKVKSSSGFIKGSLDDTRMLLAGGGDKLLSDFETPANVNTKIETAINNALSSLLTYKGSKATFADLPASGNKIGDTWNVQAAYFSFPAGTNFTWDGSAWDGLGGIIGLVTQSVAGLMSASDKTKLDGIAANAISAITKAMVEAVLTGTITTHTHQLARNNPTGGGFIDFDEWTRFDRQAGYCQVSLTEIESVIDSTSHDIEFTNYTLDIDDNSDLYNTGGSFRVVENRTYELSATIGIYSIAGQDLTFALQLINHTNSGTIIKERIFEVSAANNWVTLDISALVKYNINTNIGLRIVTPTTSYDILPDNRTWFSIHEIK